ncbi:hypothetical protein WVI01_03240 [Weissella viridescens]|uniref:Uncharacterized protein n=1 Tax=Weissella viridescens TaxID=1629 RepID=A0A0R2HAQ9_WEIVI|nr:hypothetical protein [Weissella viridescens]KRN46557.1 hypothetical protein IV50_GL000835 [Weissella viridescens]GEA94401.1 hypothetical protein WVI01_03240 [Weissella viridescens]
MPNQLQNRVENYVGLLNQNIHAIQDELNQTQQLVESSEPGTVHLMAEQLMQAHLETQWVQVPRQYSHADYFLIAMDRFMQLDGVTGYSVLLPVEKETVTLVMTNLNVPAAFAFEENKDQNGGAYFVELSTGERLFYWSLERKQIQFNARGIIDLLVGNFAKQHVTVEQNQIIATMLTEFGRYMERVFNYSVDFNLLETRDDDVYQLIQHAEPQGMLDKLFVLSADTDYFLQSIPNGAGVMLDDNTEVRIFFVNDANALGAQRWHFQVIDGRDQYSWLDILLKYDFIANWYLSETDTLEVSYDQLVFAVQTTQPTDIQSIFTAEQGTTPMLDEEVLAAKRAAEAQAKEAAEKAEREAQAATEKAEKEAQAAEAKAEAEAQSESETPEAAVDDATVDPTEVTSETDDTETAVDSSESTSADATSATSTSGKTFEEEIGEALNSSNNTSEG